MNLLIEKKPSAAVEAFRASIELLERDKLKEEANGEASLALITLDSTISTLYCNIATAEHGVVLLRVTHYASNSFDVDNMCFLCHDVLSGMGLHRKCIKSCAMALKHDPTNIRSYLIEGKAYVRHAFFLLF